MRKNESSVGETIQGISTQTWSMWMLTERFLGKLGSCGSGRKEKIIGGEFIHSSKRKPATGRHPFPGDKGYDLSGYYWKRNQNRKDGKIHHNDLGGSAVWTGRAFKAAVWDEVEPAVSNWDCLRLWHTVGRSLAPDLACAVFGAITRDRLGSRKNRMRFCVKIPKRPDWIRRYGSTLL